MCFLDGADESGEYGFRGGPFQPRDHGKGPTVTTAPHLRAALSEESVK